MFSARQMPRRETLTAALIGLTILAAYVAFTLLTLPTPPSGFRILAINEGIFDSIAEALQTDWTRLLWPMEYEPGRVFWRPATFLLTYASERYLGTLASYLLFSCVFILTAFWCSFYLTRSLVFSATLAFMFAFGTQNNYVYTYGTLAGHYLILTYCVLNLGVVVLLLREQLTGFCGAAAFGGSLLVIALSSEWWINYAAALVSAAAFGMLWTRRHDDREAMRTCVHVALSTIAVLAIYLLIRAQFPAQFLRPGAEEELLLTYSRFVLMAEDVVANFFTLLYTSLDNYLPSFVSASNALVYLGPGEIIAEQHGYHAGYQHLVVMSHLFLWRFYAGVAATAFLAAFALAIIRAWRSPAWHHATVVALMVMVVAGFSTHLAIKMRPYNSVPALPYKVLFSVAALTVLVSYLVMTISRELNSALARGVLIGSVWACVFSAALTRPAMQSKLLAQVGLLGLRDPLGQILALWR
jgi:hypothetical protein